MTGVGYTVIHLVDRFSLFSVIAFSVFVVRLVSISSIPGLHRQQLAQSRNSPVLWCQFLSKFLHWF